MTDVRGYAPGTEVKDPYTAEDFSGSVERVAARGRTSRFTWSWLSAAPRKTAKAGQAGRLSDAGFARELIARNRARFDQNELISHMEFRVKRAPRIDAEITVPGDKSISHRAVIIAALSNGICVLRGFLPSEDCLRTVQAMRALGIKIEQPEPEMLVVHGKKRLLTPPAGEIDCGNSATTMRLLAGLLAGQPFDSRLVGASTLAKRPMDRVITPLREMGAPHRGGRA